MSGLAIREAEVLHVRHPLAVPAGPPGTYNRERRSLFVKLTADDGLAGWGETYDLPGVRPRLEQLSASLIGRDAFAAVDRPAAVATDGAAVGALDIALHDLQGRALGVPVHRLLGGAVRDRVPVYASGFLYREDRGPAELWEAEATRLSEAGFRIVKVRIGRDPIASELPLLERLRAAFPQLALAVDAWGAYSPAQAREVGPGLAQLGVIWFEEPSGPRETYAGYEELVGAVGVPLAGGETLASPPAFAHVLARRIFDLVQPDVALCGGLRSAASVARLAADAGVRCVPHTWNGAVMAAATLHLAATLDPALEPLLEYDTTENRFIRDVLRTPPELDDGCFAVPDAPGLGIEVDEQVLRSYA
jgi:D-galactarolactone cycloisomerase